MSHHTFSCPRSCRLREECRFKAVHLAVGPNRVYSHTTRVSVEIRDLQALKAAVLALGGKVIGEGAHTMYSSTETGLGFTLPDWRYPVVLTDAGLSYDSYRGQWGDEADIQRLTGRYTIEAARSASTEQVWMSQDQPDGSLIIYHPDGGTLTVTPGGTIDAGCFIGRDCHEAAAPIEAALGREVERAYKPEYYAERARAHVGEDES